jgi:hypothetical protein
MNWRRPTLCIALAIAVPAASRAGDFGRPKPSLLEGLIPQQYWKGPVAGYSSFPLTDLEPIQELIESDESDVIPLRGA